jgi:hypothetical protein
VVIVSAASAVTAVTAASVAAASAVSTTSASAVATASASAVAHVSSVSAPSRSRARAIMIRWLKLRATFIMDSIRLWR